MKRTEPSAIRCQRREHGLDDQPLHGEPEAPERRRHDFGTGYSSLGYLQKFPFDKIKIDRAFIHDLPDKADSRAIVRAVTGLGSALGIVTTAEGVETKAEYDQLKREGCTEVQGYLFSEPRPAGELAGFIRGFKKNNASAA